MLGYISSL